MWNRSLSGLLIGGILTAIAPIVGCGGAETEGQVTVDKGKDEVLLKAMGDYMNKRSPGKTGKQAKSAAKETKKAATQETKAE